MRRIILTAAAFFVLTLALHGAGADTNRLIRSAAELMRHASESPTKGVPFEIVAEVTFPYKCPSGSIAVKDDSGVAILSDERDNKDAYFLKAGDVIRARGITDDTILGVIYAGCRSVEVLSRKAPEEPKEINAAELLGGKYDYVPIRIKGFIRDSFQDEIDPRVIFFILVSEGETIYVAITMEEGADNHIFNTFVGAEVTITGLCRPSAHGTRRQIGRFIKAESVSSIHIIKPPAADPFNAPDIRFPSQIRAPELSALGRRRASGNVIAVWHGDSLLLKVGASQIVKVELAERNPPRYGQTIEVVGLPETDLYNINLTRAIWRPTAATGFMDESPTNVTAAALMFDSQGRTRINTGFHGRVIRLRGIVRSMPPILGNSFRLHMECDHCIVPVDASACPTAFDGVEIGCTLDVCGTCVMDIENWHPNSVFPHVKGFTVVARTPSDVRILAWPPWWTPGRLMVVIGALLAALMGIFIWNRSLNGLAERRGRELSEESMAHIAADLKVGERTRLAIELHDALSQNLTGVSLEIATAAKLAIREPEHTLQHLDIAARSLKSCRDELRNCIWDLRNCALEEADMNDAVHRTLSPYVNGTELVVRFNVPRNRLSDNTAHALLRIIRELVQNAIRHGHAKTVKIAGCLDGKRLLFSVIDNGCGFNVENHPGVQQGHFGLQGIRERVNQFDGEMSVESVIGKGTRVMIALNMPDVGKEQT